MSLLPVYYITSPAGESVMSVMSSVGFFFLSSTQLLNITLSVGRPVVTQKVPVDITFAVRDGRGYLLGTEVSEHLRKLSLVEFSFYVGFPALQIAERMTCIKLNTLLAAFKPLFVCYRQETWAVLSWTQTRDVAVM